jgi:hypothetical protein
LGKHHVLEIALLRCGTVLPFRRGVALNADLFDAIAEIRKNTYITRKEVAENNAELLLQGRRTYVKQHIRFLETYREGLFIEFRVPSFQVFLELFVKALIDEILGFFIGDGNFVDPIPVLDHVMHVGECDE